jgi:hypothetical protein
MFYLTAGEFEPLYIKALLTQCGKIRNTLHQRTTIEIRSILTLGERMHMPNLKGGLLSIILDKIGIQEEVYKWNIETQTLP